MFKEGITKKTLTEEGGAVGWAGLPLLSRKIKRS